MNSKTNTIAGVDRSHHTSIFQKLGFSLLHLQIVFFCAWLLYFNGITIVGNLFSKNWEIIDTQRANILFLCIVLYWIRHNITLYYILVRKVEWTEVTGLIGFFALFEIGLLILGSGVFRGISIDLSWIDFIALLFLVAGSYLNTFSEIQRKIWKQKPSSKGHCYTDGLFKYSMHINYFGDIILFTGWSLFTYSIWAFIIPVVMTVMFIFIHIPGLDSYLSNRYGKEFVDYSQKTKKLIPFIY